MFCLFSKDTASSSDLYCFPRKVFALAMWMLFTSEPASMLAHFPARVIQASKSVVIQNEKTDTRHSSMFQEHRRTPNQRFYCLASKYKRRMPRNPPGIWGSYPILKQKQTLAENKLGKGKGQFRQQKETLESYKHVSSKTGASRCSLYVNTRGEMPLKHR